jgi:aspartate aminotransferase, cytoplasmic
VGSSASAKTYNNYRLMFSPKVQHIFLILTQIHNIFANMTASLSDRWSNLPPPTPDVVFTLNSKAKAAAEPKINLVIGAYRDDDGKPMPLKVIRKAERILLEKNLNYEYLPIEGDPEFCDAAVKLLYSGVDDFPRKRIAAVQSLSGTGACRLAAEFVARTTGVNTEVYLPDPTWANHKAIFQFSGFHHIKNYRYFDSKTKGVDIKGMLEDLGRAPQNSLVVLHLCAHNPTGADPTPDEWNLIADVCQQRKLQILFDSAYQGYASGDLQKDSIAARIFLARGFEYLVAQSFAKNMGLYNDRIGCLSVTCATTVASDKVFGLLQNIIRPMYSNPPAHGARLVKFVLMDATLRAEWEVELKGMADRIMRMRKILRDELVQLQTPGNWDHITRQIGMFSYLGLSKAQSQALQDRRMFVMLTGRASIAGLTANTAKLLAKGIDEVVRNSPKTKSNL